MIAACGLLTLALFGSITLRDFDIRLLGGMLN